MKALLLLAVAAPALAQVCTYTPQYSSFTVGGTETSGHFLVYAQGNQSCTWTASSSVPWITLPNQQSYVGSQSVAYDIAPNTTGQVRNGTITVGDSVTQQSIAITQIAGNCNAQITPPATVSLPVGGGSGSFQVTSGCSWYVSLNDAWISITTPTGATLGNGGVSFTASANSCVAPRSSVVTVNSGQVVPPPPTYTITEAGSQANLTLGSNSQTFSSAAAVGRVPVQTGDGCGWSAYSDSTWLQITGGSMSGSGPSAVTFSITLNTGPTRVGHIIVGTQQFTLTQTGVTTTGPQLTAMINSASGVSGAISPGEIVSLFGSSMGPAAGVGFDPTNPLSLGQVQVMFGNLPGALTYVSANQINAVVPYGVAGATTSVTVQYEGQTSNSMPATVQATTPAIFSADMSGHGPGAILNSDYTLNSGTAPAAAGSVVMIYGTGGGVTNPPSADGSLAPSAEPFARLAALSSVTVTIGGVPAQVVYAGGSPGLVSGLTQVNAVVPAGVTSGTPVPVVLAVGGVSSQSGTTMVVK